MENGKLGRVNTLLVTRHQFTAKIIATVCSLKKDLFQPPDLLSQGSGMIYTIPAEKSSITYIEPACWGISLICQDTGNEPKPLSFCYFVFERIKTIRCLRVTECTVMQHLPPGTRSMHVMMQWAFVYVRFISESSCVCLHFRCCVELMCSHRAVTGGNSWPINMIVLYFLRFASQYHNSHSPSCSVVPALPFISGNRLSMVSQRCTNVFEWQMWNPSPCYWMLCARASTLACVWATTYPCKCHRSHRN